MPVPLNANIVLMERELSGRVREIMQPVGLLPVVGQIPIHTRDRFPAGDAEEVQVTTTPDPVALDNWPLTNVIEIGLPGVGTTHYSGEDAVQMTFDYPITYTLGVRDLWVKDAFPYTSSSEMFVALFLLMLEALAQDRTLNFVNAWAEYLQTGVPTTIVNDAGEAQEHFAEWTLSVTVKRPMRPQS